MALKQRENKKFAGEENITPATKKNVANFLIEGIQPGLSVYVPQLKMVIVCAKNGEIFEVVSEITCSFS